MSVTAESIAARPESDAFKLGMALERLRQWERGAATSSKTETVDPVREELAAALRSCMASMYRRNGFAQELAKGKAALDKHRGGA